MSKVLINRRAVHLGAGLTLFAYIVSHLLNHAFGIVSIEVMNEARTYFISPWTTTVGILLLAAAFLIHLGSALWVIYSRRTLRLPLWQWIQLSLGLTIPIVLADHALANGYARIAYELQPDYRYVLAKFWHFDPVAAWVQVLLLCTAWGHACFGLHHWLKVRDWYDTWSSHFYAAALLIPTAALMGFVSAGLEIAELAKDPVWLFDMIRAINYPGDAAAREIIAVKNQWIAGYIVVVVAVFGLRFVRQMAENRSDAVRLIHQPTGQRLTVEPGATLLETLRAAEIPHASICGGRARCSTCRVRLINLEPGACHAPTEEEARVLRKLRLPPDVRLACQVRPSKNVTCEPLLPPDVTMSEALRPGSFTAGHEVELTVMFADLRGFTTLSEHKLPFDVVYLLNQYFETMGKVIEENNGTIDKFVGDGIMATFGSDDSDNGACDALMAAYAMSQQLDDINERLKNDLTEPLRLGIGIHSGPVIKGTMGYGDATQVTVIGDTVNTASRLESETKEHGVQLLFSETLRLKADFDATALETTEIRVRGRSGALKVYKVDKVSEASGFPDLSPA